MTEFATNRNKVLLIDSELAAYILRAFDVGNGFVFSEQEDEEFFTNAHLGTLPERFCDIIDAYDVIESEEQVACGRLLFFTGVAHPVIPEKTSLSEVQYDDDYVAFITTKSDDITDPELILENIKNSLINYGVVVPNNFDWYGRFVTLRGW